MYTMFGAIHPEDRFGPGMLFRNGVNYRWMFRDGELIMGVWVTDRTYSGYVFQSRVC